MQPVGGHEPLHPELGRFYDAIENPRATRNELPLLRDGQLRAYIADVRERRSRCSARPSSATPTTRCSRVASSSRCCRARAPAQRDDAPAAADGRRLSGPGRDPAPLAGRAGRRRPRMVAVAGGRLRDRGRRRRLRLRQRTPPPRRSSSAPSRSTAPRSATATSPPSSPRPARSRRSTGSATARAAGSTPRFGRSAPVDPALPVVHVSSHEADASPLGRQAAADRDRVGAAAGAPIPTRANLDQLAFGRAPAGAYPDGPRAAGAADARRRLGVDLERLRGLSGLPRLPLPRVLRGLLRRRVPGPARRLMGDPAAGRSGAQLPQLGLPERRQIFAGFRCARDAAWTPSASNRRRRRRPIEIRIEIQLDGAPRRRDGPLAATPATGSAPSRRCRRSTSTTSAARSSSSRSPSCPSTTRPAPSSRSWPTRPPRSSPPRIPQSLIELGSGSASKTRALLDAMRDAGSLHSYVPVDISEEITRRRPGELVEEYPGLRVHGVVCDFESHLERLPGLGPAPHVRLPRRHDRQLRPAATGSPSWPGSRRCSARWTRCCSAPTWSRTADRLEAAYNDSAGVTAAFNKNVLTVLNRELDADFDLDAFEHVAFYDAEHERIEIRLRSLADQVGRGPRARMDVAFARRRGDADRDLLQVHPREPRALLRRGRPRAGRALDRRRGAASRSAWRPRSADLSETGVMRINHLGSPG